MLQLMQATESIPVQELWQPPVPPQHLVILPEALQQPRDGYKGAYPGRGSQPYVLFLPATVLDDCLSCGPACRCCQAMQQDHESCVKTGLQCLPNCLALP